MASSFFFFFRASTILPFKCSLDRQQSQSPCFFFHFRTAMGFCFSTSADAPPFPLFPPTARARRRFFSLFSPLRACPLFACTARPFFFFFPPVEPHDGRPLFFRSSRSAVTFLLLYVRRHFFIVMAVELPGIGLLLVFFDLML